MKRRALISVYDKANVAEFGRRLVRLGFEIFSTGNTLKALDGAGIPARSVSDLSGFPEILDGRVKTLVPAVHAGILARRDDATHLDQLRALGLGLIDLVAVNLYPFGEVCRRSGATFEECVENIDVGGPTMIRAAAKNHRDVVVVVNPDRYDEVASALERGAVEQSLRLDLAREAFSHLSSYDALIAQYLGRVAGHDPLSSGKTFVLRCDRLTDLRYGENPHQPAAFFGSPLTVGPSLAAARLISGKPLSYNNINDADAAFALARQFSSPAAVAVKHATPCGVAISDSAAKAYRMAHDADPVSIYGGIVAVNRPVCRVAAREMARTFLEVIIAPAFSAEAKEVLERKSGLRLLELPDWPETGRWLSENELDVRSVSGGLLIQAADAAPVDRSSWTHAAGPPPDESMLDDLEFGFTVVRYVKSNAIVIASGGGTLGICGGQTNRIDAARSALGRSGNLASGAIMASDGFFPFPDVVDVAHKAGIRAIVQPGGSVRDEESIARAREHSITLVFTGVRHFRH